MFTSPSPIPQPARRALAPAALLATATLAATSARAAVPTYRVEPIATATTGLPLVQGHSETGFVCGSMPRTPGVHHPFVARLGDGLTFLPLPPGFDSGVAFDVNDSGVVVGSASDRGFPYDYGEPMVWTPRASGGYDVQQLQTLGTVLGGPDGGRAVAIDNAGQIVGWTRLRGFSGGPATLFSRTGAPIDLQALGFDATIEDLSETGIIVGGRLRMDLATRVVTSLGLPPPLPGGVPFNDVIGYAVNDLGVTAIAARCACGTNPPQAWLTYTHSDTAGFVRLNPAQLPARNVGFYDINDNGDVSATGGVYFGPEASLFASFTPLLDAASAARWSPALGFIANDRKVYGLSEDLNSGGIVITQLTPSVAPGPLDAGTTDAAAADAAPLDAGAMDADPNPDAGLSPDADAPDAGSLPDAGSTVDAGAILDAGPAPDAGAVAADAGDAEPPPEASGCSSGADGRALGFVLLIGVGLLSRRRRREPFA